MASCVNSLFKLKSMKILLLTPPMTQLNTPYPATAYLTGFLRKARPDIEVAQADPAIELVLRLLSRAGVDRIARELSERVAKMELAGRVAKEGARKAAAKAARPPKSIAHFLHLADRYAETVEPVVRFLQGKDPSLAVRISGREFLPEGPRFEPLREAEANAERSGSFEEPLAWAFGGLGVQDRAKYLASLYLDDLADVIREGIDPRFELSRYGEKLAASAPSFDPLHEALESDEPTFVDETLDAITAELLSEHRPDVVGLTAPFPGNVYGAFRIARQIKKLAPGTRIILGGGYPNTELRELSEPRVFDYVDFVTLDDGERPFLALLDHFEGKGTGLLRTFVREGGRHGGTEADGVVGSAGRAGCEGARVVFKNDPKLHDIPFKESGTPTYDGLKLDRYLSVLEMLNPMHRIWSDGRWNKLTLAHGCYWKKCNFCDISLDYIGRYDPASADLIVDRIEALVRETGQTGFHFVDEAAPPAIMRAMAERLIARGVTISWWGNVRFEKTFTPELARLLARSGCIAVSGGLEVASDRLLKLMNKGVTVEQVARVTHALTQAGILVHAYLMYGFPTQNEQETVDSLERVRQLFAAGCIQSAYWHRFSATAHSPIGRDPARFGIVVHERPTAFARNDLPFEDPTGCDHERLGYGLRKAVYNYMLGYGLDQDVRAWFEEAAASTAAGRGRGGQGKSSGAGRDSKASRRIPRPDVAPDLVERAISEMR